MRVRMPSCSPPGAAKTPVGWRLLNSAHNGAPAPIFSCTAKRPVGVLKLPDSNPTPNRDVETGQDLINSPLRRRSSIWREMSTRISHSSKDCRAGMSGVINIHYVKTP